MKRVIACLMVGLFLLPSAALAEKVKIHWFVGIGAGCEEELREPQQAVVDAFNASQDKIELVLEVVANDDAYEVLTQRLAEGNAPDIVGPAGVRARDTFKGAWLDLQPLVESNGYDLNDFDQAMVDFYRVEGEGLVGLPFAIYPSFIFVNKTLFDEAGLPYPPQEYGAPYVDKDGHEKPWDMEALRELAMQLTLDANGNNAASSEFDSANIVQFGFGEQWADLRGLGALFGAGTLVDDNGKADIPPIWAEAWKWFHNAMWKDFFHPNEANGNSEAFGGGNWFESGKVALVHCHQWYAACCMGKYPNDWDAAVVPSYQGKTTAKLNADTFEITKASKHPQEAFQALSYLLGEGAEQLLQVYGGMPARKSLQNGFFTKFNEQFTGQTINWQVVVDSVAYADIPNHESWLPNMAEARKTYREFGTRLSSEADLDLDAELTGLKEQLQAVYDAAQ